jgi:hypothetical protein
MEAAAAVDPPQVESDEALARRLQEEEDQLAVQRRIEIERDAATAAAVAQGGSGPPVGTAGGHAVVHVNGAPVFLDDQGKLPVVATYGPGSSIFDPSGVRIPLDSQGATAFPLTPGASYSVHFAGAAPMQHGQQHGQQQHVQQQYHQPGLLPQQHRQQYQQQQPYQQQQQHQPYPQPQSFQGTAVQQQQQQQQHYMQQHMQQQQQQQQPPFQQQAAPYNNGG